MPVVSHKSPSLWTRGVAARETLSYLDRRGIDAKPALFEAGLSRRQLSREDIGLSVASQYRFLELAATEANDQLLGLLGSAVMCNLPRRAGCTLWFVRTLHKETNRHFNPLRITFTHPRNSDLGEVHRLLQCPVDFARAVDTWVLPQHVMDLPIVSADSQIGRAHV